MGCGINDYVNKLTAELDKRKGSSPVAATLLNDLNKIMQLGNSTGYDNIPSRKGTSSTNHTGGAYGADSIWADMLRSYGVTNNHYRPVKDMPTRRLKDLQAKKDNVISISKEEQDSGKELNTKLGNSVHDLNNRNFVQVLNSDAVFAVAPIKDGRVQGGTGSATRMASELGKQVYVLDTETVQWMHEVDGKFVEMNELPKFPTNFAAVGTRGIESYPKKNRDGSWGSTELHNNTKEILALMQKTVDNSFGKSEQTTEMKLVKDSKTGLLGQEVNGKFTNAVKVGTYEQLIELTKQYSKLLRKSLDSKDAVYYQELFDDIAKSGFGFKPITVKFENRAKMFYKAQGNAFKDERVDLSVDKQEGDANPIKLVLHEYAHIITAQELKKYPNLMKRTQQIMDNVREADPNIVKANPYAFTNEFEFIAEVVSSPKLQHALNKLTSDGVKLGLGDKVVKIFKNLLSRLTGKYDSSTLTDALEVVVALQEGKDAVVEQTELDKYLATYGGTDDISWMQEDKTKPDNHGYEAEKPLEDGNTVKVYSQFDIQGGELDGKHITYHFSPENYANRKGPDELVPEGTKVDAYLTGKYADDRMTYYTAELEIDGKRITTQQDGKRPLHITVALGEGVKPFETGMHAEQHPELVEKIPEQKIEVEASVFKGKYNSKYDKTRPAEVEPKESAKQEADIIVPTDVFRKNINRKIECKE